MTSMFIISILLMTVHFYVQFEKTYPTDSTSDGYGYAVVHMDNLDDQHFTIWELGWDTESISSNLLQPIKIKGV